jgi:hypothetical protein
MPGIREVFWKLVSGLAKYILCRLRIVNNEKGLVENTFFISLMLVII